MEIIYWQQFLMQLPLARMNDTGGPRKSGRRYSTNVDVKEKMTRVTKKREFRKVRGKIDKMLKEKRKGMKFVSLRERDPELWQTYIADKMRRGLKMNAARKRQSMADCMRLVRKRMALSANLQA